MKSKERGGEEERKKHTHTHILQTKCGGNLNKSSILAHTVACLSVMYRLALCPGYC